MNRTDYLAFCRGIPGTVVDQPFQDDFVSTIARHADTGKWFAAILRHDGRDFVNLKCDPVEADFLRGEQGLDTMLREQGSNFSGGQRQRLALARALLHDSPVYIFDEATSNIDVESETLIMEVIETLAKTKTVLLITHRLANVVHADQIYVMEAGAIVERGSFAQLVNGDGGFAQLWNAQQALENYGREQEHEEKQG